LKRWYLLMSSLMAALALFMALSLFYDSASSEVPAPEGTIEIVLKSIVGQPMDFWDVVDQGIVDAAREFGVNVEVSGPRFEKEINSQIQILDNIIQKNPPLIILAASDYKKLVESVERASLQGIPIITIDSGVDSDIPISFVATNNVDAGVKAGEEMKRLIDEHDRKQIAIVSHIQETATAIERERGVRSALEGENIIGTWFCDVEQDIAYQITLELLKNPDLGGIVALNEVASLGVARAIRESNSKRDVLVVGFDNAVQELSDLEEGIIQATVVQRPYNMGYLSVKAAADYLKGNDIDPLVDTGSVLITKDNMFERQYQELLFPFSGIK
jgi:ribose transport system substrate-binding protein